ncbi:MAG TPA: NAD(P)/FAD-dependent oxidoreductase [Thermoanaerobaculia bacterium]|jgi:kynurenine 3-monooxygenase|nr:NAD(P)/FAD-dependent oxidoreductase [Thermoanaerobaculia bacterium]
MKVPSKVTIVGGGMSGPLMAIFLARRGCEVEIYERRGDLRRGRVESGKSIKLTLAERGLSALGELGLVEAVKRFCVPLYGRAVHSGRGVVTFQPYGKDDREVIYSFSRNDLNRVLLDHAESYPNIRVHFHHRCVEIDKESAAAVFHDSASGRSRRTEADVLIGADGAFSIIRQQMQRGERADYRQDFLPWGYKEISLVPPAARPTALEKHALHVWPCGDHMMFALPNVDGTLNGVCVLPFEGEHSFAAVGNDEGRVRALFESEFGDALPYAPRLLDEWKSHPISEFVTTRTSYWHHKGKVVLLGDACHSVVPFYGQGMNAAFEDCSVLNACLGRHPGDWEATLAEYQALRKRNTDVLADLSTENFHELRDTVRRPIVTARKRTSIFLNRLFSSASVPLYTMISHSTLPYTECLERARRQDRIARWLGLDLVVGIVALHVRLRTALARRRLARQQEERRRAESHLPAPAVVPSREIQPEPVRPGLVSLEAGMQRGERTTENV